MSGITDPSEEYFKDGLWGWVVNQWKKLIADAAGHLQVDVVTSGLPAGGATAANQATMITALQLIDDLRNALNSIATDELDIVFDGQNVDVEVTQTTPADLCTGAHGWDGSAWHKLPMVWGYSEPWVEVVVGTAVGAGNAVAETVAVGAGYVHIGQIINIYHDVGANNYMSLQVHDGVDFIYLLEVPAATSGLIYQSLIPVTCPQPVQVQATLIAPGAGKTITLQVWGYKMRIAE